MSADHDIDVAYPAHEHRIGIGFSFETDMSQGDNQVASLLVLEEGCPSVDSLYLHTLLP